MAVDMFLKMDGVKGESLDHKHKGATEILAWSWGMSNSGTAHSGGGLGAGKVNVHDLSLTKYIDSGTPSLQLHCCSGKHFPSAILTIRKAGEKPLEYLVIKMSDVLITSVNTGGHGGGDRLTENLTLNFAKVEVTYTPQDEKGKGGDPIPYGWNIAANTKV